jgi:hypothetical protein
MDAIKYAAFMDRLLREGEFVRRPRWAVHKWIVLEGCDDFGELSAFDVQCLLNFKNKGNAYEVTRDLVAEGLLKREYRSYSLTDYGKERLEKLRRGE